MIAHFKGVDAIRPGVREIRGRVSKAGATTKTKQRLAAGDYAYMLWTGETADNVYELAADTFFPKDAKIVVQSFTAKIIPKSEVTGRLPKG